MEPVFTLTEAAEISGVAFQTLNQWIARGVIEVGATPEKMRRTLYSVADLVAIAVIGDLANVIAMRPGIATAFLSKALLRLSDVARKGFDAKQNHFLVGWQSGPDTFSVKPFVKMSGIDWAEFEHPIALVPIDKIIRRVIRSAEKVRQGRDG
jgi:hypothetical protein